MITSIIQNVSHMIVAAAAIYAVAGRTNIPINPEKKRKRFTEAEEEAGIYDDEKQAFIILLKLPRSPQCLYNVARLKPSYRG